MNKHIEKFPLPEKIKLEASSACQLKCPSCPTASGAIKKTIGSGFLKIDDFKKLVDENRYIKSIELSNYGEVFLNPDILKIFQYAYEKKVNLTLLNGVNLNNVKEEVLEGLIKYQVQGITCSIDGVTQETYSQYRVKGDLKTVLDNIEKINFYKKKYKSKFPELTWQFIVFGHNEHEIPLVKQKVKELNMKLYLKKTWDNDFSPIKNPEYVSKIAGWDTLTREEYYEKTGKDYMRGICHQLWDNPQINFDGRLLGCCRNFWGDFGENAFSTKLSDVLQGEKITYARKMLMGEAKERDDIPCTTCSLYHSLKENQNWLQTNEIYFRISNTQLIKKVLKKLKVSLKI